MNGRLFGFLLIGVIMTSCSKFDPFLSLTEQQMNQLDAKAEAGIKNNAFTDKGGVLSTSEISAILDKVKSTTAEPVEEREVAYLRTSMGPIVLAFYTDVAPEHCTSFKRLVKAGYFNHTRFHRIIDRFVIQGGDILTRDDDPDNDGTGGPGYTVKAEFNGIPHDLGIVSMARSQDPNSAGSQFFICLSREGTKFLDGKYTVFAKVIGGLDTVQKLGKVETLMNKWGEKSSPAAPVYIEQAVMIKR